LYRRILFIELVQFNNVHRSKIKKATQTGGPY
jgi:hypothetical protein